MRIKGSHQGPHQSHHRSQVTPYSFPAVTCEHTKPVNLKQKPACITAVPAWAFNIIPWLAHQWPYLF